MTIRNTHLLGSALVALAVFAGLAAVGGLYQWEKSKRASQAVEIPAASPTPPLASQPPASPSPGSSLSATPTANSPSSPPPAGETSYARDVLPILKTRCFACHSAAALGGFRLDTHQSLMSTGSHAPTIVPGSADGSLFYQVLKGPSKGVSAMPPGSSLGSAEIELIGRWISQGASDN